MIVLVKFKIEKKDICDVDPVELWEKVNVTPIENSRKCVVEFDGKKFIAKCNKEDIIKEIKKKCSCSKCGRIISL